MFFKNKKSELDMNNIPQHIGIIMDGNGRWAKAHGLPRQMGHRAGAEALEKIVVYCDKLGVKAVTAYAFSTENWSRSKKEVDSLMELLYEYLLQAEEKFKGKNVILKISGDRSPLSDKIKSAMIHAEEITRNNTGLVLNMAINYGGRAEIVNACKKACLAVKSGEMSPDDMSEDFISSNLYTSDLPEVDLIIRPSGELRLSNFLLWQSAYAEFWFSDINWPAFKEKDMKRAICDYQRRNRRFGGR